MHVLLGRLGLLLSLAHLVNPSVGFCTDAPQPATPKPRLVVLVVFDQMRGDYPTRWKELYGAGGFERLMKEGTWYSNCHYPYGLTVTGAGHASLATGCEPYRHGIIANDWYERGEKSSVYCAKHIKYRKVSSAPEPVGKEAKDPSFGCPDRLLVPTLADAWKAASGGKGKVVALSMKDRGCVFIGGKQPDACYWFDDKTGAFVTSTYYGTEVAPWVAAFNANKPADAWFGKDWTRMRGDIDYTKYSSIDDQEGEASGEKQGRTFPHPMTGGLEQPGEKYYLALVSSPFANELLLNFSKEALAAEQLGQDDTPDLLSISFSANDLIGHTWGPDSQEVLDVTLRTDALIAKLLNHLDEKVGKGRYLLVLSADHGVSPLPEVSRARGLDAVRLTPADLQTRAETFLQERFGSARAGKGKYIENLSWPMFYLNRRFLADQGVEQETVEAALAEWLCKEKGVQAAYTRRQLTSRVPGGDAIGRMLQRSFQPERAGDVIVVLRPYCYCSKYLTGTGHGMPHPHDTHVPLMVCGAGVPPRGERQELVTPLAAPRILAHALGIDLPFATAELPVGVFEAAGK